MMNKPTARIAVLILLLLVVGCGIFVLSGGRGRPTQQNHMFDPLANCATEFGTLLGYAGDIPAFSNCHRSHQAQLMSFTRFGYPHSTFRVDHGWEGTFISGISWTTLEYVSRFVFHHKALQLYSPQQAHEVWDAEYFCNPFEQLAGGHERRYDVVRLQNFAEAKTAKERKRIAPKFSDIVVWSAEATRGFDNEGHVAVVVHTEGDVEAAGGKEELLELTKEQLQPQVVYIAEQNFDNKPWEGRNFSRVLRFSWRNGREAVLQDSDGNTIIGWVRPGKMRMVDANDDDL